MSCDVGKATAGLDNELWRRLSDGRVGEWAELSTIQWEELILQTFRHFTYVTAHSTTLPSLHLRHAHSPTFLRFTYVTAHSPTIRLLHQRHSSFSNPSFASPTSQALHLRHLASRPCYEYSSILVCACTIKVFTTLPAVAFKETTNSPSPLYSLQIFSRESSLNSPNGL